MIARKFLAGCVIQVLLSPTAFSDTVAVAGLVHQGDDRLEGVTVRLVSLAGDHVAHVLTTDQTVEGVYNLSRGGIQPSISGFYVITDHPDFFSSSPEVVLGPPVEGVRKTKAPATALGNTQATSFLPEPVASSLLAGVQQAEAIKVRAGLSDVAQAEQRIRQAWQKMQDRLPMGQDVRTRILDAAQDERHVEFRGDFPQISEQLSVMVDDARFNLEADLTRVLRGPDRDAFERILTIEDYEKIDPSSFKNLASEDFQRLMPTQQVRSDCRYELAVINPDQRVILRPDQRLRLGTELSVSPANAAAWLKSDPNGRAYLIHSKLAQVDWLTASDLARLDARFGRVAPVIRELESP